MLKTNIIYVEKDIELDYPILLKSKSDSKIVLAYEDILGDISFAGIVVATSDNNGIGIWSDKWRKDAFEVFAGEITLRQ